MNGSARCASRSTASRVFAGFVLILAGVAGGLLIAELGLRLIGYSDPRFYLRDDNVGFALRPGAAGWFTREGRSYFSVNSAGRHDSDVAVAKPPHTIRIAVLGDSFTEAKHVPIEQNFCSVIDRDLPKCSALHGERVEVMNFGVAGYGTAQELITLRDRVWQYSPDIVMLAFYTGNDVLDNSLMLGQTRLRPFFVRRNGQWEIDNSFREQRHYRNGVVRQSSFGTWLRDHVRVIQLLEEVRRIADTDESHTEKDESSRLLDANAAKNINMMFSPPMSPEIRDAWNATEYLLDTMSREVKTHRALFLVVTLSDSIQVYPDPTVRAALMKKYAVEDLFYPDQRVESFGRSHGIEVLSLAEPFQRYADAHKVYLHGFKNTQLGYGHWNSEGHRLAGEMMADRICEMLDLKRPANRPAEDQFRTRTSRRTPDRNP